MTSIIPDAAIQVFLASKGVQAAPPSPRGKSNGAIEGAITGMAGPIVGGINVVANQQRYSSAQAEWTSWKQWALGHSEWASWYVEIWPTVQEQSRQKAQAYQDYQRLHLQRTTPIAAGAVVLSLLAVGLIFIALRPTQVDQGLPPRYENTETRR